MKHLSLKQCVALLRTCIVLLLLCVVSFFLFAIVIKNKSGENNNEQKSTQIQSKDVDYAVADIKVTTIARLCPNDKSAYALLPAALSEQFMQ